METVTVKLSKVTKAALDIYQAKMYAKTGKSMTNDETILHMLMQIDQSAVSDAQSAYREGADEPSADDDSEPAQRHSKRRKQPVVAAA